MKTIQRRRKKAAEDNKDNFNILKKHFPVKLFGDDAAVLAYKAARLANEMRPVCRIVNGLGYRADRGHFVIGKYKKGKSCSVNVQHPGEIQQMSEAFYEALALVPHSNTNGKNMCAMIGNVMTVLFIYASLDSHHSIPSKLLVGSPRSSCFGRGI
eukprot:GHVT01055837.1.p1 GENE.GHVT01055837.1~~GHVT01055837.1.p1  ORF type:complete len:155 (-),score=5.43 GHVT01055837.1:389-853(-)